MTTSTTTPAGYDVAALQADAAELAAQFQNASPFAHIVIDGLLRLNPEDMASFPDPDWPHWHSLGDRYQLQKQACDDISVIPEPFAGVIRQLSEPRFLKALEEITGIAKLIPDPYLTGGGLHASGSGGILAPHTDFHHYRGLNLYRRVNVLVYLNDGWQESDGGCLSLYQDDKPVVTVVPEFGRTVIFRTDDNSVHGFPVPVVEGKRRRSIALYYYTSEEAAEFGGDETTYWREHGEQQGAVRKGRFAVYKGLLNFSRLVSMAAHLVNPNQGMGLYRTIKENRRHRKSQRGF